ncbi:MAG: class I SAM-dependent methyltransferase [Candidatus Sumerlaeia bacterium]
MTEADFRPAEATEEQACCVCGARRFDPLFEAGDYEYRLPGVFYVARCAECGMVMQNPRPEFDEICRYYTEAYEPYAEAPDNLMSRLRRRFLIEPRLRDLKKPFDKRKEKIDYLDVGCAHGDLLALMSEDPRFVCRGVEPVEYAAKLARDRGFDVECATLEEYNQPDASFDLISMVHVIEHLPDPEKVVEHVHRLLKTGGVFYGETPCSRAVERRVFGRYWKIWHLPRHLYFFSPETLRRFLEQKGFSKIHITLQPTPATWAGSLRNYAHHRGWPEWVSRALSKYVALPSLAVFPFTWLAARLGYASIMHFSAEKE